MTRFAIPFAFDASTIMAVAMTGGTQGYSDTSPWEAPQAARPDTQTHAASNETELKES